MSIYNEQYKQYYEGLKSKAIVQGIRENREQEQPLFYSSYSGYNRNSPSTKNMTKKSSSAWIDIIISQLIVTLVLASTIFYMKNSSNSEVVDAFKTFKSNINKDISYSEVYKEVKGIDIDVIINKAKGSLKWIKERVDENPLNY